MIQINDLEALEQFITNENFSNDKKFEVFKKSLKSYGVAQSCVTFNSDLSVKNKNNLTDNVIEFMQSIIEDIKNPVDNFRRGKIYIDSKKI